MHKNLFGTDGIRAAFGTSPLTGTELQKLGYVIGLWLKEKYGINEPIIIGYDTRRSCAIINANLQSGLLLHNISIIDAGVLPTPALSALLFYNKKKFSCGIMISASHNSWHDNGIKIFLSNGEKLPASDEQRISELFWQPNLPATNITEIGYTQTSNLSRSYEKIIHEHFKLLKINPAKKIVLDCANGATFKIAPHIFKQLGFKVIAIADEPTGYNINEKCGALYPENLREAVLYHKADIGFAFDGDGDRLVGVNKFGEIKDGDDILALLAQHPNYQHMPAIVGTSMNNMGLSSYLAHQQKKLLRTDVGDKNVTQKLIEQNLLLGGEPSGHIIMRDYLPSGDGIATALKIIETINDIGNWEMQTFKKFSQVHASIPILVKKDLLQEPLYSIIIKSKEDLMDGQLVIRYSGTEPILRIMVEADDYQKASTICHELTYKLKCQLG